MSHLVAYLGNEPEHLACALVSARSALSSAASSSSLPAVPAAETTAQDLAGPIGWGLGFVQGGEVLLQKRPRAESKHIDFFTLARDLRADAFIARGGLGDDAQASANEADPFRFRWWLMGSVGRERALEPVRDRVLASIPDFLRRNIRGHSGGELFFHLFLAFLHDDGALESQLLDGEPVARALRESNTFVDKMLSEIDAPSAGISAIVTNGRCLVARSISYPLQYLKTTGIMDCTVCRQTHHTNGDGRRYAHEALRAVVVETGPNLPPRSGWTPVPPGAILTADSSTVTIAPAG